MPLRVNASLALVGADHCYCPNCGRPVEDHTLGLGRSNAGCDGVHEFQGQFSTPTLSTEGERYKFVRMAEEDTAAR